jgi:hypothetical protein
VEEKYDLTQGADGFVEEGEGETEAEGSDVAGDEAGEENTTEEV